MFNTSILAAGFLDSISVQVGTYLPGILTAVAVLVIGWFIAHLVAKLVKTGLDKSGVGAKISNVVSSDGSIDASGIIGKILFYLIMIFVLITFFNVLNLPVVSEPLNGFLDQIFAFLPRIISAGVLAIIAYVLARVLKEGSKKGLEAIDIDGKIASLGKDASAVVSTARSAVDEGMQMEDGESITSGFSDSSASTSDGEGVSLANSLPEALYWLVFALFLPAILGALQMPGLLEPVQAMFTKAMNYVPNLIGAAVILLVGFFIANIVKQIVTNLASSFGVNAVASKAGLSSDFKISDILGMVVYAMVLLPIVVAALNTLDIAAVTEPAKAVLTKITSLIPGFIGAAIVLAIAFFVAKIVSKLVTDLLAGVGFDKVPETIGLKLSNATGANSPSNLAGKLTLVAIMLLSVLQALPMMGLDSLAGHFETFAGFGVKLLTGVVIFGLGLYLANMAAKFIKDSGMANGDTLSLVARIGIMVFAGGFALQQIGLAPSIVNVAFGSLLGGLGLAAAIAFGWGGRDAAKRVVDRYVK